MFNYDILQTYNDLEMLVYSYIMEHKDAVKYMTIRELAEADTRINFDPIIRIL